MGGSFAMTIASKDKRIQACCNNGGMLVLAVGTFFSKMVAFCGLEEHQKEQAINVWRTVTPVRKSVNHGYPLLMLQGGKDPMVTMHMSQMLLDHAPTDDSKTATS
ncbi:MAG: hypothetical protein CBARDCOR_6163 [uncultured Caballeronia sp.]|nr:MAG: hypothetical protein CBARDCOR_6163 [uncultured Caballeronia sp.]